MRKRLLYILMFFITGTLFAQKPYWLEKRPQGGDRFIYGIGSSPIHEKDYEGIAKKQALVDLASQIEIKLNSSSVSELLAENDDIKRNFNQNIKTQISLSLYGQQLIGSYKDGNTYYVCFELNKQEYLKERKRRIEEIKRTTYTLYEKGVMMENQGRIMAAVEQYIRCIKKLTPILDTDMQYQGEDLFENIYSSLRNIWNGIEIGVTPNELTYKAYTTSRQKVSIQILRRGSAIQDIPLSTRFAKGTGEITTPTKTNSNGLSSFDVLRVTGKEQEMSLTVQVASESLPYKSMPKWLSRSIHRVWSIPNTQLPIHVAPSQIKVFIKNDTGVDAVKQFVRSMISQNYFDQVEDKSDAQVEIRIEGKIDKGELVEGGSYNLQSYYTTGSIELYDRYHEKTITSVSQQGVKTLLKQNTPKSKVDITAWKGVLKRLKPQFKKALSAIDIEEVSDDALTQHNEEKKQEASIPSTDTSTANKSPQNKTPSNINISSGLVGFYSFDQETTANLKGKENSDAVPASKNTPELSKDTPSGKGYSLKLNGEDYLKIPRLPIQAGHDYSVSVWVKTSHGGSIIGVEQPENNLITPAIGSITGGKFYVFARNDIYLRYPTLDFNPKLLLLDGQWHHLVVTFAMTDERNGIGKFYMDGKLMDTEKGRSKGLEYIAGYIGHTKGIELDYIGLIDQIKFYNKTITHQQITNLFKSKN
ncbi:hypothetical protein K4L44_14885 [Halosquirtibacter laminarini]|uniref:Uncharacterized protein n=1 Tax=Halosquirtibacter laminarini TaxID=3374600 RepID=A0AC61NK35_9BACT|nr:hypothetical protein K4L44_14885 [Prolixibacteraceae bacterium]